MFSHRAFWFYARWFSVVARWPSSGWPLPSLCTWRAWEPWEREWNRKRRSPIDASDWLCLQGVSAAAWTDRAPWCNIPRQDTLWRRGSSGLGMQCHCTLYPYTVYHSLQMGWNRVCWHMKNILTSNYWRTLHDSWLLTCCFHVFDHWRTLAMILDREDSRSIWTPVSGCTCSRTWKHTDGLAESISNLSRNTVHFLSLVTHSEVHRTSPGFERVLLLLS